MSDEPPTIDLATTQELIAELMRRPLFQGVCIELGASDQLDIRLHHPDDMDNFKVAWVLGSGVQALGAYFAEAAPPPDRGEPDPI